MWRVGLIGLLGLSLFSDFVGTKAGQVADSFTGVNPPGESGGDGDGNGGDGTDFTMLNPTNPEDLQLSVNKKNNNGDNLVYSDDSNVVNVPLPNSNTNAGGEGGNGRNSANEAVSGKGGDGGDTENVNAENGVDGQGGEESGGEGGTAGGNGAAIRKTNNNIKFEFEEGSSIPSSSGSTSANNVL